MLANLSPPMNSKTARPHGVEDESRAARRLEAHRRIMRRSRERRRLGRMVALVEIDEAVIDFLVRGGRLRDDVSDPRLIASAITSLLQELAAARGGAPPYSSPRAKLRAS